MPKKYATEEERVQARKLVQRKYDQKRAELHKERIAERNKVYRENNRDKYASYTKKWREENPVKAKLLKMRMNFKRRGAEVPKSVKLEVIMSSELCGICKGELNGNIEIDHIIPIKLGGDSSKENLQATHSLCNKRKGATSVCPAY